MTTRFWGVIALVGALLLGGGWWDWSGSSPGTGLKAANPGAPTLTSQGILQPCDASQPGYIGPLVPGQGTPAAQASSGEGVSGETVPRIPRSTRAGFSIATAADPGYWAGLLRSGWYLDWSTRGAAPAGSPEHWQMVRVHEDCISPSPQDIREYAMRYPGQVWIIGNEPDVIWQDNVTPAAYAASYHELYQLIKLADPTAEIAVGGIAQATPLRLQYLDRVLQAYQQRYQEPLPADWWTVHGYVLREEKDSWGVEIPPGLDAAHGELYEVSDHARLDLFEGQLTAFRQWMKDNGYQDTPLALTEFGILMPTSYGFPTESIADYLEQTFTWLYQAEDASTGYPGDDYRLVQKWAWFSISDPTYSSSDLGDLATERLTLIGERFRDIVSSMEP